VQILRVCRQINKEGSEVFFGENRFRFWMPHGFLNVRYRLRRQNFNWLKELTISVPFASNHFGIAPNTAHYARRVLSAQAIVSGASQRVDFLANRITRFFLDAVANSPNLRRLNLAIPPNWSPDTACRPSDRLLSTVTRTGSLVEGYLKAYLHAPDVWEDLAILFQYKPNLEVTVIRLYWPHNRMLNLEVHERLCRKLSYRLGVWDFREAAMRVEEDVHTWTFPEQKTEHDPNDLSKDLHLLFGESL